ncbi:LOW QUALITY PROTEIN: Gag protein, partial [Phytophthora palmivora]
MDGLKVGPSRTQLFRVHANTMEEAIQVALQEDYSHRQARTPTSVWQGHNASTGAVQGAPAAGASTGPVPMELCTAVQSSIRCYRYGKFGHMQRACPAGGQRKFPSKPRGSRGPWQKPRPKSQGNWGHQKSSGGLLVVHASVRGYGDPFRVLIDSAASTNFDRRQMVARNGDKYADALRESEGRGQVSPWIDWRGKAIGASRPAVSDRAVVSNVPTSVRDWGARDGRQGAYAPEEVLGVTDSNEDVAMGLATGHETKAHCQACGIATTASPNAESRRAVLASTVAVPDGTDQAGNIGGGGPQAGNVVPQTAEAVGEDAEGTSGVGNIVPHEVEETEKKIESAVCVSSVVNVVPSGVKKTSTSAKVPLGTSRVDNQVPHSQSETPPARPIEEQYHVFDGVSGRQVKAGAVHLEALSEVSALLILEELSMKDFLA